MLGFTVFNPTYGMCASYRSRSEEGSLSHSLFSRLIAPTIETRVRVHDAVDEIQYPWPI